MKTLKLSHSLSFISLCLVSTGATANTWPTTADQPLTQLPGEYSVPVPPELVPYSAYPSTVCWAITGNSAKLSYRLPPELTGSEDSLVELTGTLPAADGPFEMAGPVGDASCSRLQGKVSCHVGYHDLEMSLPKATALLSQKFADPSVFKPRLEVSERFQHEPVGIIEFAEPAAQATPAAAPAHAPYGG